MKTTKEVTTKVTAFHIPPEVIDGQNKSLVKLATYLEVKNKKADPAKITDPHVLNFMEYYAACDRAKNSGEWLAGEIYWLYFQAAPEVQGAFIEGLAKRNRLPLPDGTWTPRQRLVQALYGNNPDDVEDGDGKYDSKGGKRITAAMRVFLARIGLKKRKVRNPELYPRRTRRFLAELYEIAKPNEVSLLNRLIARRYGRKAVEARAA